MCFVCVVYGSFSLDSFCIEVSQILHRNLGSSRKTVVTGRLHWAPLCKHRLCNWSEPVHVVAQKPSFSRKILEGHFSSQQKTDIFDLFDIQFRYSRLLRGCPTETVNKSAMFGGAFASCYRFQVSVLYCTTLLLLV